MHYIDIIINAAELGSRGAAGLIRPINNFMCYWDVHMYSVFIMKRTAHWHLNSKYIIKIVVYFGSISLSFDIYSNYFIYFKI